MKDKKVYEELFFSMHPGFFDAERISGIPEDLIYEEMILDLKKAGYLKKEIPVPEGVTFGYYTGNRAALLTAVHEVDYDWPQWFTEDERIFCGYVNGEIASFCIVDDMGTHSFDGHDIHVGGPSCVGTVPKFRKQGIGLEMIRRVTNTFTEEGYDISYIHYTGVAPWYRKLGYETVLKWDHTGII